jgi:hypothetical protein
MKDDVDKAKTPEYQELVSLTSKLETARETERKAGRHGAINERQYAHLKLLDRCDEDEKQRFLAEKGKSVEQYVHESLALILKCDAPTAKNKLQKAFQNILSVPLTITFKAENLFSDSTKDEPAYGSVYTSEVVYSRKKVDLEDLVGRGEKTEGQAAITGGQKKQVKEGEEEDANWVAERGKNYLRWRTDKDDREGRQDRLPFEDQQIFGAANPSWQKAKGATPEDDAVPDGSVGSNYYGNAHFLLKDSVRNRIAYVVRGGISNGGGKTAFQRKDFLMLFYDMIMGGTKNKPYIFSLIALGTDDYVKTSNAWEFHLYGGFDIRKDAEAIYIADVVEPAAKSRIEAFAKKHGIRIGDKASGVPVVHSGAVVPVELDTV